MSRAKEALLEEIRERKEESARLRAEAGQYLAAVDTLRERIRELVEETRVTEEYAQARATEAREALDGIAVLQNALTYLQEHGAQEPVPEPVIERVPAPPVSAPAPEPAAVQSPAAAAPPRKGKRKGKPDPVKARRKEMKEQARAARETAPAPESGASQSGHANRYRLDPTVVLPKGPSLNRKPASGTVRTRAYEDDAGGPRTDLSKLSPTQKERADIVYALMEDAGGTINQYALTDELTAFLQCKRQTGASIVTECIHILRAQGRILWTGQKVSARPGSPASTALWKTVAAATPPERASAGLGIHEDDFAGRENVQRNNPYKPPVKGHFEARS